jgi:hypothetical protein
MTGFAAAKPWVGKIPGRECGNTLAPRSSLLLLRDGFKKCTGSQWLLANLKAVCADLASVGDACRRDLIGRPSRTLVLQLAAGEMRLRGASPGLNVMSSRVTNYDNSRPDSSLHQISSFVQAKCCAAVKTSIRIPFQAGAGAISSLLGPICLIITM